jgi:hypothetical protein
VKFGRVPRNLIVLAECRGCGDLQGAHHLVEGGTLVLGALGCEYCGLVDKPGDLSVALGPLGGRPTAEARIEVDDRVHMWPEVEE